MEATDLVPSCYSVGFNATQVIWSLLDNECSCKWIYSKLAAQKKDQMVGRKAAEKSQRLPDNKKEVWTQCPLG